MHRGVDKIGPRSAGYPFPGSQYPPPREPSEIPASGGFRFVGPRIQFRDYVGYLPERNSCNSIVRQSTVNGSFRSRLKGDGDKARRTAQRMGLSAQAVTAKARAMRLDFILTRTHEGRP